MLSNREHITRIRGYDLEKNMSNPWFENRKKCPACASERSIIIYEKPYDEPPVRDYLVEFYSPHGGSSLSILKEPLMFYVNAMSAE